MGMPRVSQKVYNSKFNKSLVGYSFVNNIRCKSQVHARDGRFIPPRDGATDRPVRDWNPCAPNRSPLTVPT